MLFALTKGYRTDISGGALKIPVVRTEIHRANIRTKGRGCKGQMSPLGQWLSSDCTNIVIYMIYIVYDSTLIALGQRFRFDNNNKGFN